METAMMNGMCRCCASEGVFKDIKTTYTWMGAEEIYADMLKECFDINVSESDNGEDGGICEVCITQLRNASNFKKQVLNTEEQFKNYIQSKIFKSSMVKVELMDDPIESDDNNLSADETYSGAEYEVPIKKEDEEAKPKKRKAAAEATTSRTKKSKAEVGESSTKRVEETVNTENQSTRVQVSITVKSEEELKERKTKFKSIKVEFEKHLHNVREILQCTNATTILKQGGRGYACSFCPEQFPKASDLKSHTLNTHDGQTNVKISCASHNRRSMFRFTIRLDITALNCKLCGSEIDSLKDLMEHLVNKHDKVIHTDIKNHIIPFKFDTERLTCCLCFNTFDRFKILQEHMHKHYRNYICDVCDAGYINQGSLRTHALAHIKGNFPCNLCPKVFETMAKKIVHVKTHMKVLNRCGYCNEGFREYYMKEQHLSQVHGIHTKAFKCEVCDKSFTRQKSLKIHIKKSHLMEREHKCTLCEMAFFRRYDLTQHMLKHSGVKMFKCEVCLKSYGRKQTLTEHMRIHTNDRRYKCDNCGQTFVHKRSWKTHVKTMHKDRDGILKN